MACSDVEMTDWLTHTHMPSVPVLGWFWKRLTACVPCISYIVLHHGHVLAQYAWRTLHSRQVRMHLAEVEQALAAIACCIACQKLDLWTVHRFRLKGIFPYKYIKIHQDTSSKSGQGMVWQSIYISISYPFSGGSKPFSMYHWHPWSMYQNPNATMSVPDCCFCACI